jgi:hypothetical protein
MVIREEIEINVPLNVVWRIFSQMEDWDSWNTACRNCCITAGDASLAAGTCFSFAIRQCLAGSGTCVDWVAAAPPSARLSGRLKKRGSP